MMLKREDLAPLLDAALAKPDAHHASDVTTSRYGKVNFLNEAILVFFFFLFIATLCKLICIISGTNTYQYMLIKRQKLSRTNLYFCLPNF